MTFDIIEVTEEELKKYSTIQMQLLRTAQKNKNKLLRGLEKDTELFKKLFMTNNMRDSTLLAEKRKQLESDCEYEIEILREQLLYSLELNRPNPDEEGSEDVGYVVDYSLSYVDRYNIVRAYYMSIEDPVERFSLYKQDETAKKYLETYYQVLSDVLSTYVK